MSCIRCVRFARELCWTSDIYLPLEFQKYKTQLDKEAEEVPSWFHEKLLKWLGQLPTPHVNADEEKSKLLQDANTSHTIVHRRMMHNLHASELILNVKRASQTISMLAKNRNTPMLPKLLAAFAQWKDRLHMLNSFWRGIFCFSEDWISPLRGSENAFELQVLQMDPLFAYNPPIYYLDIHHLRIVFENVSKELHKESNSKIKAIVSDVIICFDDILRIIEPCSRHNFAIESKNYPPYAFADNCIANNAHSDEDWCRNDNFVLGNLSFSKECSKSLLTMKSTISNFQSKVIRRKFGFCDHGDYYLLSSRIINQAYLEFTILEISSGYSVKVQSHPEVV